MIDILHALMQFFGLDNGSSPSYLFWSGIGSDISELAILGAIIAAYRRNNCHVKGCWWLGRHHVSGTPYVVCAKHHPAIPPGGATHEDVVVAHQIAEGACLPTADESSDSRSNSAG